ncbi:hypothetical protein N7467_000155 [Penicillium canescens]|nr:hypothetical protein N7467_000155 [Penicillium canescens]
MSRRILNLVIVTHNMITVPCYSKTDLWMASLKIIAVVGLILLGVVLLFIRRPNYERFGLEY